MSLSKALLACRDDVAQAHAELSKVGRELLETVQQADKRASLQRDLQGLEKHSQELSAEVAHIQSSLSGLESRKRQLLT